MDKFMIITEPKDFKFASNLTIAATFDKPYGKFPGVVKDAVFMESTNFHSLYANKLMDRVLNVLNREITKNPDSEFS